MRKEMSDNANEIWFIAVICVAICILFGIFQYGKIAETKNMIEAGYVRTYTAGGDVRWIKQEKN